MAIDWKWGLGVAALLLPRPAAMAIPPPAGMEHLGTMRSAMERLSPFLGRWAGVYEPSTPYGTETYHPFRDVQRAADVVIIIEGGLGSRVSVIDFDVGSGSYRLFRPGFQNPAYPREDIVFPLRLIAPNAVQWSRPDLGGGEFVSHRSTITVTDDRWQEKEESVRSDGSAVVSEEFSLSRTPAGRPKS
jgi:hypothetical protein